MGSLNRDPFCILGGYMKTFDFEVFKYDWVLVSTDMLTDEETIIINDKEKLEQFVKDNESDLLIGFNNSGYDNFIAKGIIMGLDPYHISDIIIRQKNSNRLWRMGDWNSVNMTTYDVSFGLGFSSLKENEAYLGMSIDECPIPFDIDRPLKQDEMELVIEYCRRDNRATKVLFEKTKADFETKVYLLSEFNLGREYLNKGTQTIIEKVLGAETRVREKDEFDGFDFTQLNLKIDKYKEIIDHFSKEISEDYKSIGYKMKIADVNHYFGIGGIHGALSNFRYDGELMLIDVEGYYPSMMIEYDWFARSIPQDKKHLYAKMKADRSVLKKTNTKLSNAYKLVLNTTYGCYKYPYTNLFDPRMSNNITIGGQVMLVDLIEQIEPYCKLVQSNTDGIIIIPKDKDKILELISEWESRTKMKMEVSYGDRIIQKDVNNYILRMSDGKIKAVGGYVRQYNGRGVRRTMSVVDKAIVEYFMHDVSIEDYIESNNDLLDYQIISKVGKTYDRVFFEKDGEKHLTNFVNRAFAGHEPCRLYKQKEGKNQELVANHPKNTLIWNDDLELFDIYKVDKSWYIDMANRRVKDYLGR